VRLTAIATALAAVAVNGCSQLAPSASSAQPGSKRIEYRCPNGTRFNVLVAPGGGKAKLELGGILYELGSVGSASGAKFSDGTTSYWSKGRDARIERSGKVLHRDCKTSN
jgi:membrane-bound inhibitor of C-type lysozyme